MFVQALCTAGRLFVLAGAIWKGKSELNEMSSIGVRKYFQTTVTKKNPEIHIFYN